LTDTAIATEGFSSKWSWGFGAAPARCAGAAESGSILGSAPGCLPQADKPSPHPHRLDVAPFVNGPPLTIVERKNLDDEQTSASA